MCRAAHRTTCFMPSPTLYLDAVLMYHTCMSASLAYISGRVDGQPKAEQISDHTIKSLSRPTPRNRALSSSRVVLVMSTPHAKLSHVRDYRFRGVDIVLCAGSDAQSD